MSTEKTSRLAAKPASSDVVQKIAPRTSKANTLSRKVSAAKTGTRADVNVSSSGTSASQIRAEDSGIRTESSSRMKVIEAGDRPSRTREKTLSGDISSVRMKPENSTAANVVDTKRVSRRPADRTGTSTLTAASTETTRMTTTRTSKTTTGTDSALITASELDSRPLQRTRLYSTERSREPQIVINGNKNVVVQGDLTKTVVRPRIATRQLVQDVHYDHHDDHRWKSHSGVYFSFAWSNASCGRVAYLPYRYHHSWCDYPIGYYPYYGLSYYYPAYHRKYIFVSIGGYWPTWYHYRRYYWYGCHPYYWYGSTVISEPYQNVTYNTYNYYSTEDNTSSGYSTETSTPYYELGQPKQIAETPVDEPTFQTPADLCFANAVDLFEAGNYADAAAQFREAVSLSPDDIVLPFTYSQALFASGDYSHATSVLREAIAQIPDDELTIYYPRGLYKDEKVLTEQIAQLETAVLKEPFDSDYQLLLGYQHLGMGDMDKARGPLTEAAKNVANAPTADKLLELAAKLEQEAAETKSQTP